MSADEEKAIEYFNTHDEMYFKFDGDISDLKKALGIYETDTFENDVIKVKTLLNLIKKQQAEIEKKDKIIDKMAETFSNISKGKTFIENNTDKEEIKEYFTNKVKGGK